MLLDGSYGQSIDLWSCGCILAEMANRSQTLIKGRNNSDQLLKIFSTLGTPDPVSEWPDVTTLPGWKDCKNYAIFPKVPFENLCPALPETGIDLLKTLLSYDPSRRGHAKDLIHHPYFKEIKQDPHWSEIIKQSSTDFLPGSPWKKRFGTKNSSNLPQISLTAHTEKSLEHEEDHLYSKEETD